MVLCNGVGSATSQGEEEEGGGGKRKKKKKERCSGKKDDDDKKSGFFSGSLPCPRSPVPPPPPSFPLLHAAWQRPDGPTVHPRLRYHPSLAIDGGVGSYISAACFAARETDVAPAPRCLPCLSIWWIRLQPPHPFSPATAIEDLSLPQPTSTLGPFLCCGNFVGDDGFPLKLCLRPLIFLADPPVLSSHGFSRRSPSYRRRSLRPSCKPWISPRISRCSPY